MMVTSFENELIEILRRLPSPEVEQVLNFARKVELHSATVSKTLKESRAIYSVNPSRIVTSDADIMGGTPVFTGTRVPFKTLLDYLEAGDSLDEFLDHFPSVSRAQAIAALELGKEMLLVYADPA